MTSERESPAPNAIEELLPWHAAGTLDRRDAERVEAALARDPELARRFELVRQEFGATIELNESLGAPSARAMETLFAKIDMEPRREHASLGCGARIVAFFDRLSPRTLAYAAAAAVIAIVLQAGMIGVIVSKPGTSRYETASAPTVAPGVGSFALIRFAPQAAIDDINKFLEMNHFNIVAGPSGGGLYKVRVAEAALARADLGALIQKLQKDKIVSFVAPTR